MDDDKDFYELSGYRDNESEQYEKHDIQISESIEAEYLSKILHELRIQKIELEMQNDELKSSKVNLEQSEKKYRTMLEYAPIPYVTLDEKGSIRYSNVKACEVFESKFNMKPFILFVDPEDHEVFYKHIEETFTIPRPSICEIKLKLNQNTHIYVRLTSILVPGENESCLTAIVDIDEMKRKEQNVRKLAYIDMLTGLPNRVLFVDRLKCSIDNARQFTQKLGVVFIDLDEFKNINDSHGHDAGDLVLKEISQRMSKVLRQTDTVCRMGGDEFIVLLNGLRDEAEAAIVANKILKAISETIYIDECEHNMSASIGISTYPLDGETAEELIKNADTAMYKSKGQGKNRISYYNNLMKNEILNKVVKERSLRRTLENNELFIEYQPQIDLKDGSIRGMEALLRWNSKEFGMVSPNDFIPLAEETAFINPMGEWVLLNACNSVRKLHEEEGLKVNLSVNISPLQIKNNNFVDMVKGVICKSKFDPEYLELEITEGIRIVGFQDAVKKFEELKEMGIKICLDDFGTGYSSLNYLKELPIDILKLDKSLINDINESDKSKSLLDTIILLSHRLGIKVVAEGVETWEQEEVLKNIDCDIVQGYYHFKPISENEIIKLFGINKCMGM